VGTPVSFTATATGSSGYEFRFWVSSDGGASWTSVQAYSPVNTYSFPADTPGDYLVAVWVRTSAAVDFDTNHYVSYAVVP
jgi:hypothetical protein